MKFRFRVWLRSKPGFYEQYRGKVDVFAEDSEQAIDRALAQLKRTSFPDRDRSLWTIEQVEVLA